MVPVGGEETPPVKQTAFEKQQADVERNLREFEQQKEKAYQNLQE